MNMGCRVRGSALLVATALFSLSFGVQADDYHYVNMLIGDRASGMGGSYTGISDDATGLYYNPAGIIYANGRNISASANTYHMATTSYKNVIGGSDWRRESGSLLPNFFGVIQPLGPGVVGFSYAVTDAIHENQDLSLANLGGGSAITRFTLNVNNDDNTYKLGPSYALPITDSLSVGLTLYFHMRNSETILSQEYKTNSGFEWTSAYLQTGETGVEPVLGVMWSPADRLSVGATLRQSFVANASGRLQVNCTTMNMAGSACPLATGNPTVVLQDITDRRVYPLQGSLGVAYFPSDKVIYSADFHYYQDATNGASASTDSPYRSKLATWDASVGMEYYLDSTWAVRGGLFTRNANTPQLQVGSVNGQGQCVAYCAQPDHVDAIGLSASFSRFSRNSSITAGFAYSAGSGKAQAAQGVIYLQDAQISSLSLFLSTSYTY